MRELRRSGDYEEEAIGTWLAHLEYLLMTPFTSQNRDNMISWLAASCDFPEYRKMLLYQLPKEKLVYGPTQIEAMINQSTPISQQLTLWDQRGSRVIRGKLIVTPIEHPFLYIVPLYLQAEGTNFPQLKRVIAVANDKIVMEPTLDEAINALFGAPRTLEGSSRFLDRINAPDENWKLSLGDIRERRFWHRYVRAFEECLGATSIKHALWYVIPADDKENARLIVSRIVIDTLEDLRCRIQSPIRSAGASSSQSRSSCPDEGARSCNHERRLLRRR